jgi:stage IV sporulation protein B
MRFDQFRRIVGVILLGFLISLGFINPVKEYIEIPKSLVLFEGQQATIANVSNSMQVSTDNSNQSILAIGSKQDGKQTISIESMQQGNAEMLLTVGNFPIKKVDVKVLPDFRIIPGGQTIGVKLNTVGVLVVGHHLVETNKGEHSPGEEAGIQVGDIIKKINGDTVQNMSDVASHLKDIGKENKDLNITILRDKKELTKKLKPVLDKKTQKYRIGLYIRDSAAGIGTMTFYEPKSGKYGALGHVISDMDTKQPIVVHDGKILESTVTSIEKGSNGHPGEKLAKFRTGADENVLGNITKNTPFGIFGKLNKGMKNGIMDKPMPIALSHQVKEGPAKILTVVKGEEVKEYDVEIVSSIPQKFPATKGLVIKITDPELLKETGGIVQGMSGSPIIQDGKVIGAVTHVFVNDPTSGYGVHIEWMLHEAGINIYEENRNGERVAS